MLKFYSIPNVNAIEYENSEQQLRLGVINTASTPFKSDELNHVIVLKASRILFETVSNTTLHSSILHAAHFSILLIFFVGIFYHRLNASKNASKIGKPHIFSYLKFVSPRLSFCCQSRDYSM